ncbi:pectate lyase [Chryseolinea soli]|nr:pectate lyase [Chryseolinea soli]
MRLRTKATCCKFFFRESLINPGFQTLYLAGMNLWPILLLSCLITLVNNRVEAQSHDPIADRMLVYQRSIGGWPKFLYDKDHKGVKVDYSKALSDEEADAIRADSLASDATYDNHSTSREIRYLIQAYKTTGNKKYLRAAEKGIRYILNGQYKTNGGWPQFYPVRKGYPSHITYNDDAMVNNLEILQDIVDKTKNMEVIDSSLIALSKKAVDRGVQCILLTQVKVDGKLTAWCAQHDTTTLRPANARAFEPAALNSSESAGIVRFLMRQQNPSPKLVQAITSAMEWFENSRIEGYQFETVTGASYQNEKDRVLVADAHAVIWARFYEIETNAPFFTGRDGIKRKSVSDIEYERRNGYAWYGSWPQKLLDKDFPIWKAANKIIDRR